MRRWLWTIAEAFLFVLVLVGIVGWVVWELLPQPKQFEPKQFEKFAAAFGDVAGSVFSALAFAGLIVTAFMQREELSLQRRELRETREELRRTADAQAAHVETAKRAAKLSALTALFIGTRSTWQRCGPLWAARRGSHVSPGRCSCRG